MAALTILTRLPFASRYLYSWDSVQFALALKKFDMLQHQPHPPGYILYVFLGKLISLIFSDANYVYVVLSILASVAAVILFYKFTQLLFSSYKLAVSTSLILIFNPYFWYFGEVASTYIFDALFAVIFTYLTLLIIRKRDPKYLYYFSFFIGVSGGFRQSLIFFFVPIWLFSAVYLIKHSQLKFRQIATSIFIGIITVSAWFLPLLFLSGGWQNCWAATNWQLSQAAQNTSIFKNAGWNFVWTNLKNIAKVSLTIINLGFLVALLILFLLRPRIKKILREPIFYLFLFWLIPSYFIYAFVHFGNKGYLMTVAPALIIIFSTPMYFLLDKKGLLYGSSFVIIIFEIIIFLFPNPASFETYDLNFNWQNIRDLDKKIETHVKKINEYSPQNTILLTLKNFNYGFEYFRLAEYYLPNFDVYELFSDGKIYFHVKKYSKMELFSDNIVKISPDVKNILIITDNLNPIILFQDNIFTINIGNGENVYRIDADGLDNLNFQNYHFQKK